MDNDVIICRCEDITYGEIIKEIRAGVRSLEELKRILRCGMGPCQGRTCLPIIAKILAKETGISIDTIDFPKSRPPLRPVPFSVMAGEGS